ncbi:MAG: hypothetical protein ACM3XO_20970 [Bacteroidota bacterium]
MRCKLVLPFILLVLAVSACSGNAASASPPPEESFVSNIVPSSSGQPPTPFPDTPSPPAIDAPLVENPSLLRLDMFNELDGWGVTETQIVRTNDGGLSWYNLTPPAMTETGYSVDAFFLDNEHAWVQKQDDEKFPNGGTLSRTADGGHTWMNFTVPFSRGDISFLDANNGWMLAGLGVGAGSNAVAVFQTQDGGATWERTYSNDPHDPKAGDSLPLGGLKADLVALDMKTAWVTGLDYAPGDVYLYRTDDGGRSWTPVNIKIPPDMQESQMVIDKDQLKFVSATDGYLALRMSNNTMQTAVYFTQDAGNTWNLTPAILDGAGPSSFITTQDAVIYNGQKFLVTRDAARTWVEVAPDVSFGETFVNMEFVNPMTGWVITMDPSNHRSLYRTLDGGSTWLPVVP